MQVSWNSRQGRQRQSNHDAATVAIGEHQLVAVLVDAAESRQSGGNQARELAHYWSQFLARAAMSLAFPIDANQLTKLMRQEQATLRHRYLREIASYCLVVLNPDSGQYQVFHCGDTLAGTTVSPETIDSVQWLHPPHTLTQQYAVMGSSPVMQCVNGESGSTSPVLTRCLNSPRFHCPDMLHGTLDSAFSMVIASDGYWDKNTDDDSSVILIRSGQQSVQSDSDCDNLFVFPESTTVTLPGSHAT